MLAITTISASDLLRLRCDDHELERRIKERDRNLSQKQEELNQILQAQSNFDNHFPANKIFHMLDTTNLSEKEAAIKIFSTINK